MIRNNQTKLEKLENNKTTKKQQQNQLTQFINPKQKCYNK